ncbi:MAG: allantoate amidohydrolase [Phreatobacter sp.]|uniref:allantoate amidohydrolase n=1 Tax=Phreatobacter sp. TaxID=1966341 RepID=UPI0040365633
MTDLDIDRLGRRAEAMLDELAAISEEPDRLTRRYLTPEHKRAAHLVAQWMAEAGMATEEDAVATIRGHYPMEGEAPGANAVPRLLIGSHIDTVINAGKYDGMLGVVCGILAVEHFRDAGRSFPFAIDVLAFGDEEGVRFPTVLSSSAAVAGAYEQRWLEGQDRDGVTLAQALADYGLDPAAIPTAAMSRDEALAYVEIHIEQGPVLEHQAASLGVVTSIAGQFRTRVTVSGMAGHAGTVPMPLRQDALLAASEMMLMAESIAKAHPEAAMVATVGQIGVKPGAINVIPDRVEFVLDLRAAADAPRHAALESFTARAEALAGARGCSVVFETYHDCPTAACAPWLQDGLADSMESLGLAAPRLVSGAGHDGQAMAGLTDFAMMFVRCRGGISHNPLEFATVADMGAAVAALIRFIERFEPSRRAPQT